MRPNAWTVAAFAVIAAILAFAAGVVCWQEPVASGSIASEGLCIDPTDETRPGSNDTEEAGVCSGGAVTSSASPDRSLPSALPRRPGNGSKGKGMPPPNPYESFFRECGRRYGVPWWLLSGMGYETSHFNPNANGPTNDRGIMQVIDSNAAGCGLVPADLYDPYKNICCAAWLMERNLRRVRELGARGNNAYLLSLMRNNMGAGNVDAPIAALPVKTWEAFKFSTPQWPGKHAWIERLWARAQEYRRSDYVRYGIVGAAVLGAGLLLWATVG